MPNPKLSLDMDGVLITGEVTARGARDFTVAITHPYCNLSGGLHSPYFSPRSFEGEYGDHHIRKTLSALYVLGRYIEQERAALVRGMATVDRARSRVAAAQDTFGEQRRELRAALRRAELDNRRYQKLLGAARRPLDDTLEAQRRVAETFFKDHFPMVVTVGQRAAVLAILRDELPLRARDTPHPTTTSA